MAEYLARDLLGEGDLTFGSAGTATQPGHPPSEATAQVMSELGIDVSAHRSSSVWETGGAADLIYALSAEHREALASRWPAAASRIHMLDPANRSIADPYGRSMSSYRRARDAIVDAISARLSEWRPLPNDAND
jgi:protein-tyrosine phosphatase